MSLSRKALSLLLSVLLPLAPAYPQVTGKREKAPARPSMRRVLDLPYAGQSRTEPGDRRTLDLYLPAETGREPEAEAARGRLLPVLVMIHGGAWAFGRKRSLTVSGLKARYFTGRGFCFASLGYRLTPEVRHPEHVRDVAAALAFLHDHVVEYGGDPERIFVMGHSAGAHLAALVATDARRLGEYGKDLSILKGVIVLDTAAFDLPVLLRDYKKAAWARNLYLRPFGRDERVQADASPIRHLAKGRRYPPFLIFHTGLRKDAKDMSEAFARALRAIGGVATTIHAKPYSHGLVNSRIGVPGDPVTVWIDRFLDEVLRGRDGDLGRGLRSRRPSRR